jgi:hypothetical protein
MNPRLATLAATALLPTAAIGCEPPLRGDGVQHIEGARHVVAWRTPAPLPLAQFFALDFAACARDGSHIAPPRVGATMPEHGHGMNYRPGVEALGDGRFRASGLLLHMPGRWQLSFTIGGETLSAALIVD